jgi:hypothetical protein
MRNLALSVLLAACSLGPLGSSSSILHAQSSQYVRPVANCGRSAYEHNMLIVENICDITVSIKWTSYGNVWGAQNNIEPAGHRATGSSREDVDQAGGVDLFTCPGNSTPEGPDGKPLNSHYKGEYRCRR